MSTKLIKDKDFFQITCEKKAISEIKWSNGETLWIQIEGYASTKDKDRGKDIVEPSAFKSALDLYMTNPIVLLQHNADKPIGTVTEASIDDKGLYIKANITENEDNIFSKLKNGVIRAFSIGYRVKDFSDEEVKDEKWIVTSFETVIKDLELFEISLVSIPMNPYALTKSMESCFAKSDDEYENNDKYEELANTISTTKPDSDENSDIVDSNETDQSENVDENATDEEDVSETPNSPIVEKAAIHEELSVKSLESYLDTKVELMKKAFNDDLSKKDIEIKDLKENLTKTQKILEQFAECLDSMDSKMSNTIIQSGYAYQTSAKKKSAYSNLVRQLKASN